MDNLFTQEIEVGLPYRFGIAIENQVEHFNHETVNANFSIEGRWALADWDKIPLNPTLFAEYKFGTGRILHEEAPEEEMMDEDEDIDPDEEEMMMREEEARMQADRPNAYEFRLLLSEEIVKGVDWAFNAFLENEISGDRGREWGFAQAVQMPFFLPHERFKAGVEMQYKNFTVKDTRGDPVSSFVIGPAFAYKPTARMRFDVSPLFGVTKDSPDVQIFGVFSYVFGGGNERSRSAGFDPQSLGHEFFLSSGWLLSRRLFREASVPSPNPRTAIRTRGRIALRSDDPSGKIAPNDSRSQSLERPGEPSFCRVYRNRSCKRLARPCQNSIVAGHDPIATPMRR